MNNPLELIDSNDFGYHLYNLMSKVETFELAGIEEREYFMLVAKLLLMRQGKYPIPEYPTIPNNWRTGDDIIEDNRIVCDYTFASRLNLFLNKLDEVSDETNSFDSDYSAIYDYVADLVEYQIETATEQWEQEYFERLGTFIH